MSHSGFEKIMAGETDAARAGGVFHLLHHRYFECDYGTLEVPWDKLFGTFHDGNAEAKAAMRDRLKEHKRA